MGQSHDSQLRSDTVNPDYTPEICRFTVSRPLVVSSALYRCVPCRIFLRWRVLEWGIASRSTGLTMCEAPRVWVVLRGFVYLPPLDQGQILCRLTLSLQFFLPHRRGIVDRACDRGGFQRTHPLSQRFSASVDVSLVSSSVESFGSVYHGGVRIRNCMSAVARRDVVERRR